MSEDQHPEHQEASNADRIKELLQLVKIQAQSIRDLTRAVDANLSSIERLHLRIADIENPTEAPHD